MLTTTELSEFMKMPLLVTHFMEHKSLNAGVTVMDFLHMHYNQGDLKDADYDKDQQLPFKSHEGCINLSILICILHSNDSYLTIPIAHKEDKKVLPEITYISSAFLSSIWQPPKSC